MTQRLKDIKEKVYKILEKHEASRNNDGTLIAHFINKHHNQFVENNQDGKLVIKLEDFKHLLSFESVRRSRQKIQNNDGEFLPTKTSIRKIRKIKERDYRHWEVLRGKKHHTGDVKTENGMQTMESQSRTSPVTSHKTYKLLSGKYICTCKGSQYGHECLHIKKLKNINNTMKNE